MKTKYFWKKILLALVIGLAYSAFPVAWEGKLDLLRIVFGMIFLAPLAGFLIIYGKNLAYFAGKYSPVKLMVWKNIFDRSSTKIKTAPVTYKGGGLMILKYKYHQCFLEVAKGVYEFMKTKGSCGEVQVMEKINNFKIKPDSPYRFLFWDIEHITLYRPESKQYGMWIDFCDSQDKAKKEYHHLAVIVDFTDQNNVKQRVEWNHEVIATEPWKPHKPFDLVKMLTAATSSDVRKKVTELHKHDGLEPIFRKHVPDFILEKYPNGTVLMNILPPSPVIDSCKAASPNKLKWSYIFKAGSISLTFSLTGFALRVNDDVGFFLDTPPWQPESGDNKRNELIIAHQTPDSGIVHSNWLHIVPKIECTIICCGLLVGMKSEEVCHYADQLQISLSKRSEDGFKVTVRIFNEGVFIEVDFSEALSTFIEKNDSRYRDDIVRNLKDIVSFLDTRIRVKNN